MTRSHRHREKSGNNNDVTRDDCMEGTSARTRPLSYKEIMLRRKTKEDAAKPVADVFGGTHVKLERGSAEKDFRSPERDGKQNEDFIIKDTKRTSGDFRNVRTWVKDDTRTSSNNEMLFQDKDSVFRDPKIKLKSIIRSNRASEEELETRYHRNQKNEGFSTFGSDNGSDKHRAKDSISKELVSERFREQSKLKREVVVNEGGQFYRKTKTDKHMSGDAEESHTRHARDMTQTDNFSVGRKEKFEKRSKYKYHHEGDKTSSRRAGKKHDSETKGMDSEAVYHEKPKVKRRRSLSREHEKERGRNSHSRSPTPKEHGHTSKYKRQHGELLPYSKKDKDPTDSDKKRISNNGSSSYYKRKTGSSSGLGGYSPRKRKTDAAAKTPSPTCRSPEKKCAGWDLPSDGKESVAVSSTFPLHASDQNLMSNVEFPHGIPVTPTTLKTIGISHLTLSSQMHAVDSIQLTQATRPMRRLYVENLPASATEKDLLECINNIFLSSGVKYLQATQPCISCIIHKEKGQALLEFLTPEDASVALSFDGKLFFGCDLKLRRPKDYSEVTTGLPEKLLVTVDSVSDTVADSPHKIFIGGISKYITSEMLLEIVRVFGPVKAYRFQLIGDSSEPCAFLEYVDQSVTSKACAGLNGMKFGGQVVTAAFVTLDSFLPEDVAKLPFYGIPEHAKPLLEKPTAVLKLLNVLDPEGLLSFSDSELEEIMEDIKLECSKFGIVKSINIVKPTNPFVTTTEAYEVKTINASMDGSGSEFDYKSYNTKQVGESVELLETWKEFESSGQSEEIEGRDESVEAQVVNRSLVMANSLPDETTEKLMNDDKICEPPLVDGNTSAENPSFQENYVDCTLEPIHKLNVSSINFGKNDSSTDSISAMNTDKLLIKKELITEEDDANIGIAVGLDSDKKKVYNTPEDGDKKDTSIDLGDVFEPGSVLVEYKRAEASCMAAHNLHGRCFDGRVVTVAYVDHDLYQTRFFADKRALN